MMQKERMLIFGTGSYYTKRKKLVINRYQIVAFLDNNSNLIGNEIDRVKIYSPEQIANMQFDKIFIASTYRNEIIEQLLGYRIPINKIMIDVQGEYLETIASIKNNGIMGIETYHDGAAEYYLSEHVNYTEQEIIEYENRWKTVKDKYSRIYLHILQADGIGEMVDRMLDAYFDKKSTPKTELHLLLPAKYTSKEYANSRLLEIVGRYINLIDDTNKKFWGYIYQKYQNHIDITHFDEYRIRKSSTPYLIENQIFEFNKAEIEEAEHKFNQMNLDKDFVCMHIRDSEYVKKAYHKSEDTIHDHRNASIENYYSSIDYLETQRFKVVRMGKYTETELIHSNCIDFSNLYYDELLDLYLCSKCKFFIGSTSGLATIPPMFKRPSILVNITPIAIGFGSSPYTSQDMYIPKKYWHKKKKRLLNLKEMLDIELECTISREKYEEQIVMIENTKEEILEAVQEMYLRLKNEYVEDRKLMEKYWDVYENWKLSNKNVLKDTWIGEGVPFRIADSFLRKNKFLLENQKAI